MNFPVNNYIIIAFPSSVMVDVMPQNRVLCTSYESICYHNTISISAVFHLSIFYQSIHLFNFQYIMLLVPVIFAHNQVFISRKGY